MECRQYHRPIARRILFWLNDESFMSMSPAWLLVRLKAKMKDRQGKKQYSGVRDQEIHAALDQHWAASDANDF